MLGYEKPPDINSYQYSVPQECMSEIREDGRVEQLRTLVDKAILETAKISRQPLWYPIVVASVIVAGIAVTILTLSHLFIG